MTYNIYNIIHTSSGKVLPPQTKHNRNFPFFHRGKEESQEGVEESLEAKSETKIGLTPPVAPKMLGRPESDWLVVLVLLVMININITVISFHHHHHHHHHDDHFCFMTLLLCKKS